MSRRRKLPLPERAELCRKMAADHRAIAADTLRRADEMEADARDLDAGDDPFRCGVCGEPMWGGRPRKCEAVHP